MYPRLKLYLSICLVGLVRFARYCVKCTAAICFLTLDCCLFERLFNVKKNGVFLFGLSCFVLEIFTFLYYANEESDDVIGGSTKTAQHSIENNSRNIKAVFFKLGTSNVHHKRYIMTSIVPFPWQPFGSWFCFFVGGAVA